MQSAPASLFLNRWPWVALVASALMLGAAHYAQRVDDLAPCILCLRQRGAHWLVLGIAALGVASNFLPPKARQYRLICILLALAFLYSAGQALYHVGAEMKWWPGPKACAASGGVDASAIAAMLDGGEVKILDCSDPTYWPFKAGLTMAGWNLIISLLLVVGSIAAVLKGKRP